jgi:hypothetical protein
MSRAASGLAVELYGMGGGCDYNNDGFLIFW